MVTFTKHDVCLRLRGLMHRKAYTSSIVAAFAWPERCLPFHLFQA
jgi:hypothetical protein